MKVDWINRCAGKIFSLRAAFIATFILLPLPAMANKITGIEAYSFCGDDVVEFHQRTCRILIHSTMEAHAILVTVGRKPLYCIPDYLSEEGARLAFRRWYADNTSLLLHMSGVEAFLTALMVQYKCDREN